MSDGAFCHNCRKPSDDCICLSSGGIKMLKVILALAKAYDDSNPQCGMGWNNDVFIAQTYLKDEGLEICANDFRIAKQ